MENAASPFSLSEPQSLRDPQPVLSSLPSESLSLCLDPMSGLSPVFL